MAQSISRKPHTAPRVPARGTPTMAGAAPSMVGVPLAGTLLGSPNRVFFAITECLLFRRRSIKAASSASTHHLRNAKTSHRAFEGSVQCGPF